MLRRWVFGGCAVAGVASLALERAAWHYVVWYPEALPFVEGLAAGSVVLGMVGLVLRGGS